MFVFMNRCYRIDNYIVIVHTRLGRLQPFFDCAFDWRKGSERIFDAGMRQKRFIVLRVSNVNICEILIAVIFETNVYYNIWESDCRKCKL